MFQFLKQIFFFNLVTSLYSYQLTPYWHMTPIKILIIYDLQLSLTPTLHVQPKLTAYTLTIIYMSFKATLYHFLQNLKKEISGSRKLPGS